MFIAENPQVSASMVTAICGIIGIFINIVINMCFRNRDYKNRNRMRQIENMELYYIPLCEKIEHTIKLASKIESNGETNIYNILSGKIAASNAQAVRLFVLALEDLQNHFAGETYKFQDDFKLFKIHRKVKNKVWELCQYKGNQWEGVNDSSLCELIENFKELAYRIQCCEVKILADNFLCELRERLIIWRTYKKTT